MNRREYLYSVGIALGVATAGCSSSTPADSTSTPARTSTSTPTQTSTLTSARTATPTQIPSRTSVSTSTPAGTATPTPTQTSTSARTATPTSVRSTPTLTPAQTPTSTRTPARTATPARTPTPTPQTQTQLQFGYYSGRTAITIQYSDIYGNPAGTQTFQSNVLVRLGSPAVAGGLVESNPFNLYVIPDPPEATAEGVYEIHSALGYSEAPGEIVLSPLTGQPVPSSAGGLHETGVSDLLLQYWQLQLTSNTTFEGVLTNAHNQEAITLNLFNATKEIAPNIPMVWQYPMARGTQIVGRSDGNTLLLSIVGNSIDGSRPFRAEVSASRIA